MTKKEQVKEFINNLNWKTRIESGVCYATIYNEINPDLYFIPENEKEIFQKKIMTQSKAGLPVSENQFCRYANQLGYSVHSYNGLDLTITYKGYRIY